MKQTKWLSHEIDEYGIKREDEKEEAILKLNPPEKTKELKSFLGAKQYMAIFLVKFLEKTDRLQQKMKHGTGELNKKKISENKTYSNRRHMLGTLRERQR